jgi:hypothetical protein
LAVGRLALHSACKPSIKMGIGLGGDCHLDGLYQGQRLDSVTSEFF